MEYKQAQQNVMRQNVTVIAWWVITDHGIMVTSRESGIAKKLNCCNLWSDLLQFYFSDTCTTAYSDTYIPSKLCKLSLFYKYIIKFTLKLP